MITEDYVSFETAKLLKAKSADFDTDNVYTSMGRRWVVNMKKFNYTEYDVSGYVKRPTLALTMKWLRVEHKIEIVIQPSWSPNYELIGYIAAVIEHHANATTYIKDRCDTYEKMCEVAINYVLKKMI